MAPFYMRKEGKKSRPTNKQLIINANGEIIAFRNCIMGADFKIHRNGLLSYWENNKFFILDKQFKLIDSVECSNGIATDSHDFLILPNGNYLLMGKSEKVEDYSNRKVFKDKSKRGSKTMCVKYDVIQELNRNKNIIFQWDSEPYFSPEDADSYFYNDTTTIDVTHFNSLDTDEKGNIIVSCRYFHQVIKISRSEGKLLWRMGGNTNTIKIVNDSVPFSGQHDARLTAPGRLSLFDNGYGIESRKHYARALEYEIDDSLKTARLIWNYVKEKVVCDAAGNTQKLKSGKRLINYGNIEGCLSPNITCEIIDKKMNPLVNIRFKDTCGSYRTFFYEKLPFPIQRPALRKIRKNGHFYLTTKKPYSQYLWSTGEETSEIIYDQHKSYYTYASPDGVTFIRSKEWKGYEKELSKQH
jgi:hypothetical protein